MRHPQRIEPLHRLTVVTLVLATMTVASFAAQPITIHGKVETEEGEPLAGVVITAVAQVAGSEPITVTAITKKKGAFKLQVPDWDQSYTITAELEGYAIGEVTYRPNPNEQVTLSFTLPTLDETTTTDETPEVDAQVEDEPTQAEIQRMAAIPVFNEGVDALQANDHATALAKFQEAAVLDPDFQEAYRGVAASALELKDYPVAANAAEKIIEMDPNNEEAVGTAYFAEMMAGNVDRMVVSAERLGQLNPALVSGEMLQHAEVLFKNNKTAQSRALLEVLVGLQPELAAAQFQLGLVCNTQGDARCTQKALGAFLELEPDSPDAGTARALLEYVD